MYKNHDSLAEDTETEVEAGIKSITRAGRVLLPNTGFGKIAGLLGA